MWHNKMFGLEPWYFAGFLQLRYLRYEASSLKLAVGLEPQIYGVYKYMNSHTGEVVACLPK